MLRRVPTPAGEVHASGKRQAVVDHDNLLMVAGPRRMRTVELQMDARMVERILAKHELRIAHVREQDGKIPTEYVDVEVRILVGDRRQKIPQRRQRGLHAGAGAKLNPAVQVPTHDGNSVPSPWNGFGKCPVIVRPVDQQGESGGPREGTTVAVGFEHRRHRQVHRTINADSGPWANSTVES